VRNPQPTLISYLIVSAVVIVWVPGAPSENAADSTPPAAKLQSLKLYGVSWHKSVDSALEAAGGTRPAKPVMVLRTLGDLAGFT
jgi:hypothetical protein